MNVVPFVNLSVRETKYIHDIIDEAGNGYLGIYQKFRAHESHGSLYVTMHLYGYRFHIVAVTKVKIKH